MKKYALYALVTNEVIESSCVMIYSFLANNRWFYNNNSDIVILSDRGLLSEENENKLKNIYNNIFFRFVSIEKYKNVISNFKNADSRFDICWLKLEIFNDNSHDKILYLDSDMVIIGDIYELFENNDDILFCEDQCEIENTKYNTDTWVRDKEYFNAGLIGVSKKWIESNSQEEILMLAEKCDCEELKFKGLYPEQDFLNFMIKGGRMYPSIKYNLSQNIVAESNYVKILGTKIIHFCGGKKPWRKNERLSLNIHDFYLQYETLLNNNIDFKKIGVFYNEDILCAIINFNNDEGAIELYNGLSKIVKTKIYDTYHKDNGGFINGANKIDIEYLNNVHYGGAYRYAWNESLFYNKKYTMVITSDVVIDDNNMKILSSILSDRSFLNGIGCYGVCCCNGSKAYGTNFVTERNKDLYNHESGTIRLTENLEGWCMIVDNSLLSEVASKITENYNIGWAYDQTVLRLSKEKNMINVIDDRVSAFHKDGCGYNPYKAEAQFNLFKKNYWSELPTN